MSEFFGRECSCYIPSDPFGHSPDCYLAKGKGKAKQVTTDDYALKDKVEEIQQLIKELDDKVYLLLGDTGPHSLDAYDHLQQIHYKLTDCKGQLGAVKYALRKGTNE